MSAYVKTTMVSLWVLLTYVLGQVGAAVGQTAISIDWAKLGYAFAGATCYVIYEMARPKPIMRSGYLRAGLIFIGMTVSMAATNGVMKKYDLPVELVATGLGFVGYIILPVLEKIAAKPLEWYEKITKPTEKP